MPYGAVCLILTTSSSASLRRLRPLSSSFGGFRSLLASFLSLLLGDGGEGFLLGGDGDRLLALRLGVGGEGDGDRLTLRRLGPLLGEAGGETAGRRTLLDRVRERSGEGVASRDGLRSTGTGEASRRFGGVTERVGEGRRPESRRSGGAGRASLLLELVDLDRDLDFFFGGVGERVG